MIDWAGDSGISFFFFGFFILFIHRSVFPVVCRTISEYDAVVVAVFCVFLFIPDWLAIACAFYSLLYSDSSVSLSSLLQRESFHMTIFYFFFFSNIHCSLCLVFRIKSTHSISILYTYVHIYDKRMGRFK